VYDHGAPINNILDKSTQETSMHYVAFFNSLKCFEVLLRKGVENFDSKDYKGNTPLILAVKNKNFIIVKYILQMGADVNIRDNS